MELTFIGQGLDSDIEQSAGQHIIEAIDSGNFTSFSAFVAFVSVSGLKNIIDNLVNFKKNGGAIRIFLGVNLNATSKEALGYSGPIRSLILEHSDHLIWF